MPTITVPEKTYAIPPGQLQAAQREVDGWRKTEGQGRRVNKAAGDMRVRRVMHRSHYFNAIAHGEDPRHDEGYIKDHVKRGQVIEVPVVTDAIVGRPLSAAGRDNYRDIFGHS